MKNFLFIVYTIVAGLQGVLSYVSVRLLAVPEVAKDNVSIFLLCLVAIVSLFLAFFFTTKAAKIAIR